MNQQDLSGLPAGIEQIKHALGLLFGQESVDNVVELRILNTGKTGTVSGYFNDFSKLADTAIKYSGNAPAVYVTLNPVTPVLLARALNKTHTNVKNSTNDTDIVKRCWFPIDLDYERPAGISSSDAEHSLTHLKAKDLIESLQKMGWSDPIYSDSGNGAHLLYKIDLPNTEESTELVKNCLNALAYLVNRDKIHVDESVFNAARIWKLYGTKACKGENLSERPHRIAKILSIPEEIKAVTKEQLIEVANLAPVPEDELNGTVKFDIIRWMKKYVLSVKNTISENNRTTYVLDSCPFDPSHKDASITQMNNGALAFNCFHNSCKDRHWRQLRLKFEPDAYSKEKKYNGKDNGTTYNQASALVQYTISEDVELFHDEKKEPYARVNIGDKKIIVPISSREFKRWLTEKFFDDTGTAPGSDAITNALNVIEAKACHKGSREFELFNRVASRDRFFWYDLGDGIAVKITESGWEIIKDPPILFCRHTHQKAHNPSSIKKGSDVKKILDYINLVTENDKVLFLVQFIASFIPDIPHPIPVLYGDKGSSKTTALKMQKMILDPSVLPILSFPHNNAELVQKLYHHYFAPFDNISELGEWQSDALCKACTGEGISKRALFTNDEDIIFNYRRCVALNGINLVADKPDLLDRAILLRMERIPKEKRKTEDKVWKEFNDIKGDILGGVFDTLVKAMAIKHTIHLDELPRMADFMEWGCAISWSLGFGDMFKEAYFANIQSQNKEAIEASPVGEILVRFAEDGFKVKSENTLDIEKETFWNGSASDLLTMIDKVAEAYHINIKQKGWPKSANVLTRRINEIKTNLQEEGILFELKKTEKRNVLSFRLTQGNTSSTSIPPASVSGDCLNTGDITKSNLHPTSIQFKESYEAGGTRTQDIHTPVHIPPAKNEDAELMAGGTGDTGGISLRNGKGEVCDICQQPLSGEVEPGIKGQRIIHKNCKFLPIPVRFLKEMPLFVGIDMRNYGPFKPDDIAEIPATNAFTVINRKAAVKILPHSHNP